MKKLLAIAVLVLAPLLAGAQQQKKDVTKFLGIPVDGTKAEMIQKLKEKGFSEDPQLEDTLLGEFNGSNVRVTVQTNKNKVCRINVWNFGGLSETTAKIRFNHLCLQFENNPKYISASDTAQTIPEEMIIFCDEAFTTCFGYKIEEFEDFAKILEAVDEATSDEDIMDYFRENLR